MPSDQGGIHGAALQTSCRIFATLPLPCRWPLSNHDGPSCADSNGQDRWSLVSSSSNATSGWRCCIRCTIATKASSDRKSTRLNSSHLVISYAVFCLKKKKRAYQPRTSVSRLADAD